MRINKKIILILLLFLGIIIFFNTNSLATTYTSLTGETKDFPEFPVEVADNEAAMIYKTTSGNYVFMRSKKQRHSTGSHDLAEYYPYILVQNTSNSTYTISCYYPIYYYTLTDDEWKYGGWYNQTKSFANITDFFYSSYDLVYNSTGAVVFPATVLEDDENNNNGDNNDDNNNTTNDDNTGGDDNNNTTGDDNNSDNEVVENNEPENNNDLSTIISKQNQIITQIDNTNTFCFAILFVLCVMALMSFLRKITEI